MVRISDAVAVEAVVDAPEWTGRQRLDSMVRELERQLSSRRDIVARGKDIQIEVAESGRDLEVKVMDDEVARLSPAAIGQLCARMTPIVPVTFFRKLMVEHPAAARDLAARVLREDNERHLVRMLDGRVRSLLSDRYKCLDHYDVALASLEAVRANEGVLIECSLTESHMRLKFTSACVVERLSDAALKHGDNHFERFGQYGNQSIQNIRGVPSQMPMPYGALSLYPTVTISNSEIGDAKFRVDIGVLMAFCTNLTSMDKIAETVHVGSRLNEGWLRRETIEVRSKATVMESVDAIASAFSPDRFRQNVDVLNRAVDNTIEDAPKAVDATVKMFPIRQDERDALLTYFTGDYSQTRFGLAQAVSRLSQDVTDPDRATALEEAAGALLRN